LKAGGTGLTLTAANHAVHLDRWWNPAVEDQRRSFLILRWRGCDRAASLSRLRGLRDGESGDQPESISTGLPVIGAALALAGLKDSQPAEDLDRFWLPPPPLPVRPAVLQVEPDLVLRRLPSSRTARRRGADQPASTCLHVLCHPEEEGWALLAWRENTFIAASAINPAARSQWCPGPWDR
jgi:hypothetical protein